MNNKITKLEISNMYEDLIENLLSGDYSNSTKINQLKINMSKKYGYNGIIKNASIIAHTNNDNREKIIKILNIKPIRELSGVTVVALFAKPHSCPHGKCIYCPGGPGSPFGDTPQSYTGKEPAALRAIRNNYDPYLQIFNRLEHYCINGHLPDKLELIFMGGTFLSLDKEYKDDFVKYVYKAINDFGDEFIYIDENNKKQINYDKFNDFFEVKNDNLKSLERQTRIQEKILKLKNQKRLNIAIDIDDVLCFTWNEVLENYNKKYISKNEKQLTFDDIKNFNFNNDEKLKEEFYLYDEEHGVEHKPYQNSLEILKKLKENGNNLSIITSRKKSQLDNTYKWIKKHFNKKLEGNYKKDFFKNLIFTTNYKEDNKSKIIKNNFNFDIVIEDAPHHINNYLKEEINTIIFSKNWNKNIIEDNKNSFRVNNWDEIYKIILSFKDNFSYKKEIIRNETAKIRAIGLTIETKPDWALEEHCNEALEYGTTRFEIGVQTLNDDCLKKTNRGHDLEATRKAFQISKDMCFKLNAHMMIGLPASTLEIDEKSLIDLFELPDFRPDMLKIYPCLVSKGTPLYTMWKQGKFKPIETKKAAEIIARAYKYFPRYVRVMRVQRDIPTPNIDAGVKNSNLRQYVDIEMRKNNITPKDIRSREIGFKQLEGKKTGNFNINVEKYDSSKGIDYFIDVVDENDILIGFIRLRFPSKYGYRKEITNGSALIRELHIYGQTIAVGEDSEESKSQHKGWGRKLLEKAEEIAKENGYNKMVIISGVGVREYYKKLGYHKERVYMVKNL